MIRTPDSKIREAILFPVEYVRRMAAAAAGNEGWDHARGGDAVLRVGVLAPCGHSPGDRVAGAGLAGPRVECATGR